jgi:hypothetical protein
MNNRGPNTRAIIKSFQWTLGHLRFLIIGTEDEQTISSVAYF